MFKNRLKVYAILVVLVCTIMCSSEVPASKIKKRNKKEIVSVLSDELRIMQEAIPASVRPYYYGSQNFLKIKGRFDPIRDAGVVYEIEYSTLEDWKTVRTDLLNATKKDNFTFYSQYALPIENIGGFTKLAAKDSSGKYLFMDIYSGKEHTNLKIEVPKPTPINIAHIPSLLRPFAEKLGNDWYADELISGTGHYDYDFLMNYVCLQMRCKNIVWLDPEGYSFSAEGYSEFVDQMHSEYTYLLEQLGFSEISNIHANESIELEGEHPNGDKIQVWIYNESVKVFYRVGDIPIKESDFPAVKLSIKQ